MVRGIQWLSRGVGQYQRKLFECDVPEAQVGVPLTDSMLLPRMPVNVADGSQVLAQPGGWVGWNSHEMYIPPCFSCGSCLPSPQSLKTTNVC